MGTFQSKHMNTSILFVHLAGATHAQLTDEITNANHTSYGLADGDESAPTVSGQLQRGERKYNVKAGLNIPLGITYLSAILKKQFPECVDQYIADYVEEQNTVDEFSSVDDWIVAVAQKAAKTSPDIIAISLMFSTAYKLFKHLVAHYRRLWPQATIVVGGIHATNCTQYLLDTTPEVDYVFRGESEVAMAKFVQNFIDNKPQSIQGVFDKNSVSDFSK